MQNILVVINVAVTPKHAVTCDTAGKPGRDSNNQVFLIMDAILVLLIICSVISGACNKPKITKTKAYSVFVALSYYYGHKPKVKLEI